MRRNHRGSLGLALLTVTLVLVTPLAHAQLVSRSYLFKPGVILETALMSEGGLRLDSVYFELPMKDGGRLHATDQPVTALVAVSNTTGGSLKAGLAIALFDDEGRLVAAASGGSKLGWIKSGRQQSFSFVFDGVYAEAHKATTFQISLESK